MAMKGAKARLPNHLTTSGLRLRHDESPVRRSANGAISETISAAPMEAFGATDGTYLLHQGVTRDAEVSPGYGSRNCKAHQSRDAAH
jgi:hypothetical protein